MRLWSTLCSSIHNTETIQVVLDSKLLRATELAARRANLNRSALIREALRAHLKNLDIREREPGAAGEIADSGAAVGGRRGVGSIARRVPNGTRSNRQTFLVRREMKEKDSRRRQQIGDCPPCADHSCRSARIGSTRIARWAGT